MLNKFRGDAALLAPAPDMLRERTGVPTVATIPMQWRHGLPEEDGVFDDAGHVRAGAGGAVHTTVAVVAYPRISNLDEFQPLKGVPGLRLVWARSPAEVAGADWIVLPGSKATAADLAWLRAQGLDAAIAAHAARGGRVLGICGGLQMLGEALIDTHGVDGNAPGLGLLPLVTAFDPAKTVRRTRTAFGALRGAWSALSGVAVQGLRDPPRPHGAASGHGRGRRRGAPSHPRPGMAERARQRAGPVPARPVRGCGRAARALRRGRADAGRGVRPAGARRGRMVRPRLARGAARGPMMIAAPCPCRGAFPGLRKPS